jgi:hypothetical protein
MPRTECVNICVGLDNCGVRLREHLIKVIVLVLSESFLDAWRRSLYNDQERFNWLNKQSDLPSGYVARSAGTCTGLDGRLLKR